MNWVRRLSPTRRWLILPPIVIGVLTVVSLAMSKKELDRVAESETPVPLRVVRAVTTSVAPQATGYGTAKPNRIWSAVAEVRGCVIETHPNLRPGVYVESGEVLVQIDDVDYKLRETQRRADLEQTRALLEQLRLNQQADQRSLEIQQQLLAVRQTDVDRLQRLSGTSAASESEYDSVRAVWLQQTQTVQTLINGLSLFPSQIAAAEASVALAQARLDEATRDVERTEIVAPYGGVLSGVSLEPNQYIAAGERLFEVHDIESVEIESQFSLSQLSQLLPGDHREDDDIERSISPASDSVYSSRYSATVTTRSGDMMIRHRGRPLRVSEAIDEQTRTLGIIVEVDNHLTARAAPQRIASPSDPSPDQGPIDSPTEPIAQRPRMPIRPGAYCEVTLISPSPIAAIVLPRTSIDDQSVYVVDHEQRLRRREVQIGFTQGDHVVITGGLRDGDLVAIKPTATAMDGRLVDPKLVDPEQDDLVPSLSVPENRP